jgi:hypothetical protein
VDLLVDDFSEAIRPLLASGWVITEYGRYDPTYVVGLTPTGKTFRLDAVGDVVTIQVATRTRSVNVAKDAWMQGSTTIEAWLTAYNALPANQR